MAMVNEGTDAVLQPTSSGSQGSRGCNFALQVALQTMKERCQQLHRRLATIEDENIALRRIVARYGPENTWEPAASGPGSLREQVAVLSLQKAQMSQQMQMVATENRQLWLRLSRLYQANQSMGTHLSRISDTLKQHTATTSASPSKGPEENGMSLEEISLRLADSIMQEKNALEEQCAEMAQLQHSSPIDLQTLAADERGAEELADAHYKRLIEVRDMLRGQQNALRTSIEALRKMDASHTEEDEEMQKQIEALRKWGETVAPDWTCPMCGQYLPSATVEFDTFHQHVTSHFTPENDPQDAYDMCFS